MMTIKEIRKITGLSQAKFSEKYGIPRRTVEDWERGIFSPPAYLITLLERVVKEDFDGGMKMFKTDRVKFGMKARAMEETAIEISRKFGPAEEYRYYDNRGTLLGRGNIRAVIENMMFESRWIKEAESLGIIEAGDWEYNEDIDETEWKSRGTIDAEDVIEMIEEHKYFYEFYREHVCDVQEDFVDDLESALLRLKSGETDRIFVRYLNAEGWVDDAFEIEYSDIEPDNDEFWSRRGNPKPALIEKIEDMELMSLKK